ncbi:unnamed protein product [Meloidogyne enterolobii]|uniref:Uncharacterized protein n=1 Tax=Meloidogyne enterolobii TaxID=390850 RepID=A0ACB0Y5H9_MELEN
MRWGKKGLSSTSRAKAGTRDAKDIGIRLKLSLKMSILFFPIFTFISYILFPLFNISGVKPIRKSSRNTITISNLPPKCEKAMVS